MKKYLPGLFAIMIAIGLSAFSKSTSQNQYYIYDNDGWHYYVTTEPNLNCFTVGRYACKISTDEPPDIYNRVHIIYATEIGWTD